MRHSWDSISTIFILFVLVEGPNSSLTSTCINPRLINHIEDTPAHMIPNEIKPNLSSVEAYETHDDTEVVHRFTTYGTYGLGIDLTSFAWPKMQQVFPGGDIKQQKTFATSPSGEDIDIDRISQLYLRQHPVDLLVLGNLD
jgi:hypothetical protein